MILRKLIASVMAATMALTPSVAVFAQTHQEPLNLNLPSMGSVAGTDLSPLEEQMLGEEIMSQIRADDAYLNDAETLDYLNHLGYRLVSVANSHTYNFFFFPIIDHSLNAFALPGGFIAVHSGLVVAAQSESELAGVVGHEIGHVSQRHIARMIDQQRHSAALTLGSLLLAILAARAGGGQAATAVAMGSQAAMIQNQLGFSRSAEREADRIGLTSLVKAGFDPKGMEKFIDLAHECGMKIIPYISAEWCDDKNEILHSVFYSDIHGVYSEDWATASFNFTTPYQLPGYLRIRLCNTGSPKGKLQYDDVIIWEAPKK
jgi:predicted Zn-dependent protease